MTGKKKRPLKHQDVLAEIRVCVDSGRYLDTRHARDRKQQRGISLPEVLFVLLNGFHEKSKDRYDELFESWSYSIRGKTVDKRNLRIVISFDAETGMLIITAIDLDADD